jgi:hypothetical protein
MLIVRQMVVRAAAQAGADYALAKGWNQDGVIDAVSTATNSPLAISASPSPMLTAGCVMGQAIVAPTGSNCPDSSAPGRYVTVSAQAAFEPIVPGLKMFTRHTITSRATVRIP